MPRAGRVSHATLVPLGQPEKAMGHESPIEPWLAPDNRAACGLRTDWLRRAETMKTAGKKNPKRCLHEAASRDHGTEGNNNPAQTRWAGRQEKTPATGKCFFLTPFIEQTRQVNVNRQSQARLWGPILKTEHNPKVNECIRLKSSFENTWPRCSYPELTMQSGSQLICSELCPQNKSSQWAIRPPIHRIGA